MRSLPPRSARRFPTSEEQPGSDRSGCRIPRPSFVSLGGWSGTGRATRREARMAKYLLLYAGGGMPDTDAEREAVMKAWDGWFHQLGKGLVDGGNPFST